MMKTKDEVMAFILRIEPEFASEYERHLSYWDNSSRLGHDLSAFSHFVKDKINMDSYPNAKSVFEGIEQILSEGNASSEVQTAVCTSFLENLLNFFTEDQEKLALFVPLLGPKSREYCKAWDKFTGVKTPGLWTSG